MLPYLRRFVILLVFFLTVFPGMAEMSSDWQKRMGTVNPDKAKELFMEFFNNNPDAGELGYYIKYDTYGIGYTPKSYETLTWLLALAPYASYDPYSTAFLEPPTPKVGFYQQLMKDEPDPAVRMLYCQDLLHMGRLLYEDNKNLNELRQTTNLAGTTMSVPLAKVWAAHLYYKYGKQYLPHVSTIRGNKEKALKEDLCYSEQKAYDLYREAFHEYREAQTEQSSEMQAAFLTEYFLASQDLYRTNPDSLYPHFLKDYIDVVSACDKCLEPLFDKADSVSDPVEKQKIYDTGGYLWAKTKEIEPAFGDSRAGSAERLKSYFGPRLSTMKDDQMRLETVINLFLTNNSETNPTVENDVFYAYCKASYALKPTFHNCFGSALSAQKDGKLEEMIGFFKEARDLATTDGQRAQMSWQIGTSLMRMAGECPKDENAKRYGEDTEEYRQWYEQYVVIIGNLKQIVELAPSLSKSVIMYDRTLPARACYSLGRCYRRTMGNLNLEYCDQAIEWFEKAEQMSTGGIKIDATKDIESCRTARPKIESNIKKRNNANTANARAWVEYQEYLKKKKAEEDFWKGGR